MKYSKANFILATVCFKI